MSALNYKIWVLNDGVTDASSSNVAFTLGQSTYLSDALTLTSPTVRPKEGKTETRPWTIPVVDSSGGFTALLADSSGRFHLLNRVVVALKSTGGSYSIKGGGRLADIALGDDPEISSFLLTVEDERAVLDGYTVFNTTNTTRLYPPGPDVAYGPFPAAAKGTGQVQSYYTKSPTKMFLLRFDDRTIPMTQAGIDALRDDLAVGSVLGGTTNFRYARVRVGGTDYQVQSFGRGHWQTYRFEPDQSDLLIGLDEHQLGDQLSVWVNVANSSAFTVGASFSSAFVHMFSAPPSEATPLHIDSTHPMQIKKALWDGSYATTDQVRPRYSTAAFDDGSTGLFYTPLPRVRFRITEPWRLSEFDEEVLNASNLVANLIDTQGRLNPKSLRLPATTAVATTSFFEFTGANLRDPHPSFLHSRREMVTKINLEYTQERRFFQSALAPLNQLKPFFLLPQSTSNLGGDAIYTLTKTAPLQHDRITQRGTYPLTIRAMGVHTVDYGEAFPWFWAPKGPIGTHPDPEFKALAAFVTREMFDRYGDGPVVGKLYGLSGASTVAGGDFARLTLGSYPNASTQARGGTRILQILGVTDTPLGPEFDYLDAGPNLQSIGQPTISLARSTVNPKHALVATIGNVPSGGGFALELARSSAASVGSTSGLWQRVLLTLTSVAGYKLAVSSGAYTIGQRPSGTYWHARVQGTKTGRIRSSWKATTGPVQTSGITTPSGLGSTAITSYSFTAKWTPGDATYPAQVFLDAATSASLSTGNLIAQLAPNTKQYNVRGLQTNHTHKWGVRHVDVYGGVSAAASATVLSLSTASTGNYTACPSLGLYIQAGTF